jgi:hypothetical protein
MLRRPRRPLIDRFHGGPEDDETFMQALHDALDRVGVAPGDEFVVARPPEEAAPGGARKGDPGTSKQAALDVAPRTGTHREKALRAIFEAGQRGATYAEVMAATGINGVWKRLSELADGKWIKDSGVRRKVVATGSDAIVYVVTDKTLSHFGVTATAFLERDVEPEVVGNPNQALF